MVEITVKLPDMLARTLGPTAEARAQRLTEDVAIEEYRAGRFSQRQVAEVLGLDYWQTESFLTERNVALNYSLADLEADRGTLDEVLGRP
jgi:predicted HTH domain antitoxin